MAQAHAAAWARRRRARAGRPDAAGPPWRASAGPKEICRSFRNSVGFGPFSRPGRLNSERFNVYSIFQKLFHSILHIV